MRNHRHYRAYLLALEKGLNIPLKCLKLLFLGLPQTGKTSVKRRLIGEIASLFPEEDNVSATTGAAHYSDAIIDERSISTITSVRKQEIVSRWSAVKLRSRESGDSHMDLDDQLLILYHFINEQLDSECLLSNECREPNSDLFKVQSGMVAEQEQEAIKDSSTKKDSNEEMPSTLVKQELNSDVFKVESGLVAEQEQEATKDSSTKKDSNVQISSTFVKPEPQWKQENKKAFEAFNSILKLNKSEEYVKLLTEKTSFINMIDVGGHPAFLEILPLIIGGPAMYLVFFNLTQQLTDMYSIQCVTKDCISQPESSYTVQQVLLQMLSTISCFHHGQRRKCFEDSPPAAIIVGTHRDQLKDQDIEISVKDSALKHVLKPFIDSGLLCAMEDGRLIMAVDNITAESDDVEMMHRILEDVINKKFDICNIPASWLMFRIFLKKLGTRIMSLEQCMDVANELHVYDCDNALWFFHYIIGNLLYFPIKGVEDIVICDPQLFFDAITNLIFNTFNIPGAVDEAACKRFRESGLFSYTDIQKSTVNVGSEQLPIEIVFTILQHCNIIAPVRDHNSTTENDLYLFPAVLSCAKVEDLQIQLQPQDPAPLMIHFKCGYAPAGLFCATVASLISRKKTLGWQLSELSVAHVEASDMTFTLYKNKMTFCTADYDITLISLPKRYEVHIARQKRGNLSTEKCCFNVLQAVCDTLDTVISTINHVQDSNTGDSIESIYELGFKCTCHSDPNDLMVNKSSQLGILPKQLWLTCLQIQSDSCFQCFHSGKSLKWSECFKNSRECWFYNALRCEISKHPKSQTKHYGDSVTFEVVAHTVDEMKNYELCYQWTRNNESITPKTHPYTTGASTTMLCIDALLSLYEGNYSCIISIKGQIVAQSDDAMLEIGKIIYL